MPAYTHLRTFINALQTGKTHITECLDAFFASPGAVQNHPHYNDFITGNWSAGLPGWLGGFLDEVGLTPQERDHVLAWPPVQLEATRAAAAAGVQANKPVTFFWELYHGDEPLAQATAGAVSDTILFRSPGSSVRLTNVNYGEVYVEEV